MIVERLDPADPRATAAGLPGPGADTMRRERPDRHVRILGPDGAPEACASLWWTAAPALAGERVGAVGHFAATGADAARAALDAAAGDLAAAGCTLAVGPLDGTTWRSHRLWIATDGRPPFFLEPAPPREWDGWWRAAGFTVLSTYTSSEVPLGDAPDSGLAAAATRLAGRGVATRGIRMEDFDGELRRIHAVSLAAFARNFLYAPVTESEFVESYRPVRAACDPAFVRIAEDASGAPCGFLFGLPDLAARRRGEVPMLIVKTLAVVPGPRFAGLGSVLVEEVRRAARDAGLTGAIYALQHETNTSNRITGRHGGRVFRRYALLQRRLAPPGGAA